MKKATVSKLQIAQANLCVGKCENYSKGLGAILSMCELVAPYSQYNKLPYEFQQEQRNNMQTIMRDLRAMIHDTHNMADTQRARAIELTSKRAAQLEEK